jgi:hypothetical protein
VSPDMPVSTVASADGVSNNESLASAVARVVAGSPEPAADMAERSR